MSTNYRCKAKHASPDTIGVCVDSTSIRGLNAGLVVWPEFSHQGYEDSENLAGRHLVGQRIRSCSMTAGRKPRTTFTSRQ